MSLFLVILLTSLAESLIAFSGGVLAIFNEERVRRASHFLLSFAIGALLSVALLDLIPEAAEMASLDIVLPWVLGGVLLFSLPRNFFYLTTAMTENAQCIPILIWFYGVILSTILLTGLLLLLPLWRISTSGLLRQ